MTQAKTAARELAEDFWEKWRNGRLPEGNHIVVNLEAMILAQRAAVWREAEQIARDHIGAAVKKRRDKGKRISAWSDDALDEIRSEERGEDIAAEIIAAALAAKAKEESNG